MSKVWYSWQFTVKYELHAVQRLFSEVTCVTIKEGVLVLSDCSNRISQTG